MRRAILIGTANDLLDCPRNHLTCHSSPFRSNRANHSVSEKTIQSRRNVPGLLVSTDALLRWALGPERIASIVVIAPYHTEMVTGADVPPFGLRTTTVCVEGETKISRTLKLPGVLFTFFVTTHKSPFASRANV